MSRPLQIEIEGLEKSFQDKQVLSGIDIAIARGEIIGIVGPSGGGKSTLLRCINLLEKYQSGHIYYEGVDIRSPGFNLELYRQQVGMIFQSFNLFSHLNVLENLTIGQTKVLRRSKAEAQAKAMQMLAKVGLADFAHYDVRRLSGGQKQRVAIARSLCLDPEVLLLDEPTSALDPQMTDEVLKVIRDLSQLGLTLLIVTHEMRFAWEISDRILFLKSGKIHWQGPPNEFYQCDDPELKAFVGGALGEASKRK